MRFAKVVDLTYGFERFASLGAAAAQLTKCNTQARAVTDTQTLRTYIVSKLQRGQGADVEDLILSAYSGRWK